MITRLVNKLYRPLAQLVDQAWKDAFIETREEVKDVK